MGNAGGHLSESAHARDVCQTFPRLANLLLGLQSMRNVEDEAEQALRHAARPRYRQGMQLRVHGAPVFGHVAFRARRALVRSVQKACQESLCLGQLVGVGDEFDALALQLAALVPEHVGKCSVDPNEVARLVYASNAERRILEGDLELAAQRLDLGKQLLATWQRFFGDNPGRSAHKRESFYTGATMTNRRWAGPSTAGTTISSTSCSATRRGSTCVMRSNGAKRRGSPSCFGKNRKRGVHE